MRSGATADNTTMTLKVNPLYKNRVAKLLDQLKKDGGGGLAEADLASLVSQRLNIKVSVEDGSGLVAPPIEKTRG